MSSDAIIGIAAGFTLCLAVGCALKLWEIMHVRKKGRGAKNDYGGPMGFGLAAFALGGVALTLTSYLF